MDEIIKIFISSTMDLDEERNAVTEVINQFKGIPIKMELFVARRETPEQVCIEEVTKSDIYVGIFGKKYGYIPASNNPNGLSVTAIEFEKARELKKPTLIFIQRGVKRDAELESFLDKISDFNKGVYRKSYGNVEDLKYWLLASLVFQLKQKTNKINEQKKIENLVKDETLYKKYVKQTNEYADLKGLYQLRKVVQLKLKDIHVPLKLKKLDLLREKGLDSDQRKRVFQTKIEKEIVTNPVLFELNKNIVINARITKNQIDSNIKKESYELLDLLSKKSKIVILGGPGSGKTTTFRWLASSLVQDAESSITPFLIPLREYERAIASQRDLSIPMFIEAYFRSQALDVSDDFFKRHLESGSCVIMFDGLDEVLSAKERMLIASRIEKFSACFGEKNSIIVSSRIPAYQSTQLSGFDHYALSRLDTDQIIEFVLKWTEIIEGKTNTPLSNPLLNTLLNDSNLISLSTNPLLLSLICLIGVQGIPIPTKKADLYDVCIRTLVSSWEEKKGYKGYFSEPLKFDLIKRIAFFFSENNKITATEYELLELIEKNILEPYTEKITTQNMSKTILENIVERSGLLIEREPNNYGFVHLGLRDFLSASYLAGLDNVADMFDTHLKPRLHRHDYTSLICLCSRILTHQSVSRGSIFLECILNANSPQEKYIHWDLQLATKCLFSSGIAYGEVPYKILEELSNVIKVEGPDYYYFEAFKEIDFELFETYLINLTKKIGSESSVLLISKLSSEGKTPQESNFCKIALKILIKEADKSKGESKYYSRRLLAKWALDENDKAIRYCLTSIRSGKKSGEAILRYLFQNVNKNNTILPELFKLIDYKKSSYREELLVYMYVIEPEKVIKKAKQIMKDENENSKIKLLASKIINNHKKSSKEIQKTINDLREKRINNFLSPKRITQITEEQATDLIFSGPPSKEFLSNIVDRLYNIFNSNRPLAFRLLQLCDYHPEHQHFEIKLAKLAKVLSNKGKNQKRLALYIFSFYPEIRFPNLKKSSIDFIEDKNEYIVVRRGVINSLEQSKTIKLTTKDVNRLFKMFHDESLQQNLTFLFLKYNYARKKMLEFFLGKIEKGEGNPFQKESLRLILRIKYYSAKRMNALKL